MMFPFVGIARTIHQGMSAYRALFSRQSAFEHVERYVNGLLLSAIRRCKAFTVNWSGRMNRSASSVGRCMLGCLNRRGTASD
jgi:hypothetical protein